MKEIVLIDDDELIHLSWKMEAKRRDVKLHCFLSIEDFIKNAQSFSKKTKVFIDINLGNDVRGDVASEEIFKLGFLNLFLASGFSESEVSKPSWIKDFSGKRFPESV